MNDPVYVELIVHDGSYATSPTLVSMAGVWPNLAAAADALRTAARAAKIIHDEREARA